jgi:hypothetical protein
MMLYLLHMLCLYIELCLSSLACLLIILILLVGIKVKGTILSLSRPNCFQLRSQKPWDKKHVPRDDEPGIRNQVKNLCDQVKLISKILESPTPHEKNYVMSKKGKNTSNKQVWIKKSDNLCLVADTALKVLDTCLWYLDSACSKHMTGDRALLKDIQMGKGGRITFGDGS